MLTNKKIELAKKWLDSDYEDFVSTVADGTVPKQWELDGNDAYETLYAALDSIRWRDPVKDPPEDEEKKIVVCRTKKGVITYNQAWRDEKGCWHGSGSMSNVIGYMPFPKWEEKE